MALARVTYRPSEVTTVVEMLDPSRPLVRSQQPLTKPTAPRCADPEVAERRRRQLLEKKTLAAPTTSRLLNHREAERKVIKAQVEFEREKRLAEQALYRKSKVGQWKSKNSSSPFLVDLVADEERIEEESTMRHRQEHHKQRQQELALKKVTTELIAKRVAEGPPLSLQERRRVKEQREEERRQKALHDLRRVEEIWERKQKDAMELSAERQHRVRLPAIAPPSTARGSSTEQLPRPQH
jgi:hypothetical protein